ncbi:hypothetical protein [Streptomyces sp. Tue6028]|uniref:COG1470 family protein n=1 Tax=Streptomyces sp. Tue6028 TaxID=2036037 RepID=UPI003D748FB3
MPYALFAARALGLTLALSVAAPATAALGADGWSVVPSTSTADRAGARPYVYAEGAAGAVLQDSVSVLNPGPEPLTVRLRGADADNTADGAFTVRSRSSDTGAWIGFARETGTGDRAAGDHADAGRRVGVRTVEVRVPARTRADVPFTVSVPAGATPGDHPGAIVASAGGRSSAVRVHLRVGGPTLSALTVEHVTVRHDRISYQLVNRGTTVLAPRLAVHAEGVLGALLDRAPRALPVELPPGRRVTLSEPWHDPPALDSVDVRLTVTAAGGARDSSATSVRFVPWGPVAGVAGALAAVGALVVVRRRTRRGTGRGAAGEEPCAEVELTGAVS